MMSKCTDPSLGHLFHAYVHHLLPEKDQIRFETHLFDCTHCLNQVKDFEKEAFLLNTDGDVKELITEAFGESDFLLESWFGKLWRYLWPKTPLLFKPAIVYLLVLLMIFPAYHGLKNLSKNEITSPLRITLFRNRSTEEPVFNIHHKKPGLVSFVFREWKAGQDYQVVIETEKGHAIFSDHTFQSFDESGTGCLVLPYSRMKPGRYRLVLTDPNGNRWPYYFRIEK